MLGGAFDRCIVPHADTRPRNRAEDPIAKTPSYCRRSTISGDDPRPAGSRPQNRSAIPAQADPVECALSRRRRRPPRGALLIRCTGTRPEAAPETTPAPSDGPTARDWHRGSATPRVKPPLTRTARKETPEKKRLHQPLHDRLGPTIPHPACRRQSRLASSRRNGKPLRPPRGPTQFRAPLRSSPPTFAHVERASHAVSSSPLAPSGWQRGLSPLLILAPQMNPCRRS